MGKTELPLSLERAMAFASVLQNQFRVIKYICIKNRQATKK